MMIISFNLGKLKEIKPALCGYIREAQFMLNPEKIPDEKVVHDVRVLMKKSRASIKLLRTQLEEESFNKEYRTLREVGRIMRSWRESSVHRRLLRELKKKYPELFFHLADNQKINMLLDKPEVVDEPSPEIRKDIENIISLLRKSGFRLRFMNMSNLDPNLLYKELELTYDNVSDCYLRARNYPKDVNLHEFRKKTKDFLYQLTFFRSLKPKAIKDLENRLDSLGQNLGKYNDHAVLIRTLDYKYSSRKKDNTLDELIVVIKQEQDKYLSKLWPVSYAIFRPGKRLGNVLGIKLPTT